MNAISLGSFSNLFGPDMMIIAGLEFVAVIVVIFFVVRFFNRRGTSQQTGNPPEARLGKLDALRRNGLVTNEEYEQQRRRILTEL